MGDGKNLQKTGMNVQYNARQGTCRNDVIQRGGERRSLRGTKGRGVIKLLRRQEKTINKTCL